MATTKIFNYDLIIDKDVRIQNDQQNVIARDYLRTFFKQLEYAGVIKTQQSIEAEKVIDEEKSISSGAGSKMASRLHSRMESATSKSSVNK